MKLKLLTITFLALLLINCGAGSGGDSDPVSPPDDGIIQCQGCPTSRYGAHVWLYPQSGSLAMSLEIEGTVADNPAMDAWIDCPSVIIYLVQWDDLFMQYVRSRAHSVTGKKPGAYDQKYFVWDAAADDFCINDTWCSAFGDAYIELYVDDGIYQWSVLGLPDIPPPYL